MWMIYGIGGFGFGILAFLSRKEDPLSTTSSNTSSNKWTLPFRKMAVYLYKHYRMLGDQSKDGRRRGPIKLAGMETLHAGVSRDLRVLYPTGNGRNRELEYTLCKLTKLMIGLFLALVLCFLMEVAESTSSAIQEGYVERGEMGESKDDLTLSWELPEKKGTYTLSIADRQYSEQELSTLAVEAFSVLDDKIAATTSSDLDLPSALDGFPFRITYESTNENLLEETGRVHPEALESDRQVVKLKATLKYQSFQEEKTYQCVIEEPVLTPEESVDLEVANALMAAQEKEPSAKTFLLPDQINGMPVIFKEVKKHTGVIALFVSVGMLILYYLVQDYQLHEKIQERNLQMKMDYPQLLSKLVLYLGAGLSMRMSFATLGEDYKRDLKAGEPKRYAYEEVLLLLHEMESGISEVDAYVRFGGRCHLTQYTKLVSMLTANLRKGNQALLDALAMEAKDSYEERKNIAKQLGEEAGTKLLFPMILMLIVTMVMIMIPCYTSFSM